MKFIFSNRNKYYKINCLSISTAKGAQVSKVHHWQTLVKNGPASVMQGM